MAFKDFLSKILYEGENTENPEKPEVTAEEMANFEQSMTTQTEGGEDIVAMAQKIIFDSQAASDADEYPDISNVQTVLETAGEGADNELIKRILVNFMNCSPEDLLKDGNLRKEAILTAIEQTRQQSAALSAAKAEEEQGLVQAERDAEAACTAAISQANTESERLIQEEKERSAQIIAEIRKQTEDATIAAKELRDSTLQSIADQRAENETAIRNSAALVAETEKHGNTIIAQVEAWIQRLM